MLLKKRFALALLIAGLCSGTPAHAQAQSDTFAFGSAGIIGTTASSNCAPITAWDNVVNVYPQNMGMVCFNFYPNTSNSGIEIPWQLGYPNNGFLLSQAPFTWGPTVTTSSSTFTQSGTAVYSGLGAGVVVTVQMNIAITYQRYCGRVGCHSFALRTLTGGTGTVSLN